METGDSVTTGGDLVDEVGIQGTHKGHDCIVLALSTHLGRGHSNVFGRVWRWQWMLVAHKPQFYSALLCGEQMA